MSGKGLTKTPVASKAVPAPAKAAVKKPAKKAAKKTPAKKVRDERVDLLWWAKAEVVVTDLYSDELHTQGILTSSPSLTAGG